MIQSSSFCFCDLWFKNEQWQYLLVSTCLLVLWAVYTPPPTPRAPLVHFKLNSVACHPNVNVWKFKLTPWASAPLQIALLLAYPSSLWHALSHQVLDWFLKRDNMSVDTIMLPSGLWSKGSSSDSNYIRKVGSRSSSLWLFPVGTWSTDSVRTGLWHAMNQWLIQTCRNDKRIMSRCRFIYNAPGHLITHIPCRCQCRILSIEFEFYIVFVMGFKGRISQ